MAVFVIAGLWILGLMVLALLTANPVTINVQQIVRSDYVITAEFPTAPAGTLIAEKEWKHGANLREIPVENLSHVVADPGQRYIIPLSRIGEGTYRVTPARLPDDPPLVYPATSDTEQQLRDLLSH